MEVNLGIGDDVMPFYNYFVHLCMYIILLISYTISLSVLRYVCMYGYYWDYIQFWYGTISL